MLAAVAILQQIKNISRLTVALVTISHSCCGFQRMPQINPTPFMNVKSNQSKRPDIQNLCVFMSLAAAESYLAAVLLNNRL